MFKRVLEQWFAVSDWGGARARFRGVLNSFLLACERVPWWLAAVVACFLGVGLAVGVIVAWWSPVWMGVLLVPVGLGIVATPVLKNRTAPVGARGSARTAVLPSELDARLSIEMVEVPAGEFSMGAGQDEHDEGLIAEYSRFINNDKDRTREFLSVELPQHTVFVDRFQLMSIPVTRALYHDILYTSDAHEQELAQQPMTRVTWLDAIEFCNRLSDKFGYQRCYWKFLGQWRCRWSANGFRLPTEAEWEYVCRAGTTERYASGDAIASVDAMGWHARNCSGLQPVATRIPNPWGVYDMHGNVWEWCWDRFGNYSDQSVRNPTGPAGPLFGRDAGRRVVRGGSFVNPPEGLRSAGRVNVGIGGRRDNLGFRCARVPPQH